MLLGLDVPGCQLLILLQFRQIILGTLFKLAIDLLIAVKHLSLTVGNELIDVIPEGYRLVSVLGISHHGCQCSVIYQPVKLVFIISQVFLDAFRCVFNACRSDGLMGILSILSGLGLVVSGIFLAVVLNDVVISLSEEYVTHSDAVSTHVGDQTGKSG